MELFSAYLASKGFNDPFEHEDVDTIGIHTLCGAALAAFAATNPILSATHNLLEGHINQAITQMIGPQVVEAQLGRYIGPKAAKQLNQAATVVGAKAATPFMRKLAPKVAPKGASKLGNGGAVVKAKGKGRKVKAEKQEPVEAIELELQPDGSYA